MSDAVECLGLDVGSTSIKGAILDLHERQIHSLVREPFPDPLPGLPEGFFEVSPEQVAVCVARVLDRLRNLSPHSRAVFTSGQMGGVLLVDRSGVPLTNYLSWRDQRTSLSDSGRTSWLEHLQASLDPEEFAELGRELAPGSALTLLTWLAWQQQLPESARLVSIADYALGRLCGQVPRMHPTQAIGLLDLAGRDWHHSLLARWGLDRLDWPALTELAEPIGSWQTPGSSIPCFPAVGDQQAALWGASLQEDELSINISTGSQVSRLASLPTPGAYQTRAFLSGGFLHTITHLPAGRSLNVLLRLLTELSPARGDAHGSVAEADLWTRIAQAAERSDGGGLVCDLSFFKGPFGERGEIRGITTENLTVGNLFRSAFESMADNVLRCADRLWPDHGWSRLVFSGGLTQSVPLLRRLIEQKLSSTSREQTASEETLTGLLDLARAILVDGTRP